MSHKDEPLPFPAKCGRCLNCKFPNPLHLEYFCNQRCQLIYLMKLENLAYDGTIKERPEDVIPEKITAIWKAPIVPILRYPEYLDLQRRWYTYLKDPV